MFVITFENPAQSKAKMAAIDKWKHKNKIKASQNKSVTSEEIKKNSFKKSQIRNKASIFDIKIIAKKYVDLYNEFLSNKLDNYVYLVYKLYLLYYYHFQTLNSNVDM